MKRESTSEPVVVERQPESSAEHRRAFMEYSSALRDLVDERYVEVPDDLDGQAEFVVYVERKRIEDVRRRLLDVSYELSVEYGVTISAVVLPLIDAEVGRAMNGSGARARVPSAAALRA